MVKVITYGTYDLLHYGHIKLLERAKALGDYLIVGVTADDFDKTRGKINRTFCRWYIWYYRQTDEEKDLANNLYCIYQWVIKKQEDK